MLPISWPLDRRSAMVATAAAAVKTSIVAWPRQPIGPTVAQLWSAKVSCGLRGLPLSPFFFRRRAASTSGSSRFPFARTAQTTISVDLVDGTAAFVQSRVPSLEETATGAEAAVGSG